MSSLEGHSCENCGCDQEHGCVCGWCDGDRMYMVANAIGSQLITRDPKAMAEHAIAASDTMMFSKESFDEVVNVILDGHWSHNGKCLCGALTGKNPAHITEHLVRVVFDTLTNTPGDYVTRLERLVRDPLFIEETRDIPPGFTFPAN